MPTIRVHDAPLTALRLAVLRRHGKLHGKLLSEVDRALSDRASALAKDGEG